MEQVLVNKRDQSFQSKSVTCDLCREEIKHRALFYESGVNVRILCESCYRRFQENEIELMINLFNAYGGYFGKFKRFKASVFKRLKELGEESNRNVDFSSADEINLQLLHNALLFGFTPKEYFLGIRNVN